MKTRLVGIRENGSQKCACSQTFQHSKWPTRSVFWLAFSCIPTRSSVTDKGSKEWGRSSYCSSILESFTSPKKVYTAMVHSSSLLFLPSESQSSAPSIDVATPSAYSLPRTLPWLPTISICILGPNQDAL